MNVKLEIMKRLLNDSMNSVEPFEIPKDEHVIDFYYEKLDTDNSLFDLAEEFRCSGIKAELRAECSRHYESYQVARKFNDTWISWTYWFGGGKHGEPGSIDWMSKAYEVEYIEEEKMVLVRTFKALESKTDKG
tara:strand:- start:116 stop:514 length:399 start_codon:yes stop_codon:yes gene_type:complete